MATNKDKLIESAQKNLKKKQIVKAIKDYAKIVELDPADVRSRQKLAELFVRTNKPAEAFEHYEAVAKYFSSNGFYLKAIAIYKQMQRLDPSQVSIINRLAELNEKQGLVGDAMAEYRSLVDYYARNGMVADEIKTLEKMRDLDQNNLNVRVKLAEVYAASERKDDGFEELESVLDILKNKNDFDKALKLYKMFLPLYPNNKKLQMGLALIFYEKRDFGRGVIILETLLKEKPSDPDLLRLIASGYADQQNWPKALEIYQKLLDLDPSDLDICEAIIKGEIGAQQYVHALSQLEEWKDAFLKAERLDRLKEYYELLKDKLGDNRIVLQTLDSIYELSGDGDKLLDIMSEVQIETDDDVVEEETLSDSLLGSAQEDISIDDLDLDPGEDAELIGLDVVEDENIDLELESLEDVFGNEEEVAVSGSEAEAVIELNDGADFDFDFAADSDDDLFGAAEPASVSPAPAQHNLRADLEEAEFYLQQGLFNEAEKQCRDILAYAPDNEECRQKLADIEKQRNAAAPTASATDFADGFGDFDFDSVFPADSVASPEQKKVFRTDVDEQIAADDMESHYNLGIAYREMGLLDDAISEFEKAEKEPSRYVDCQTLKGLSYSDKEDYGNAEIMFQQALDSPYLEEMQRLNLGYELGLLYERAGRANDALISFQDVLSQDSNYRDVRDRVKTLKASLGLVDEVADNSLDERKERISFL